ncbi:hypothetical protein B0H19DRAFT_1250835 [Mycena capillaripes]|nr:hypothetical protein B0H19DRAFT_1250835 [Mycena capillaripes]
MTVNFDVLIILAGLLAHAGLASTMDLNGSSSRSQRPAGWNLAEYLDTYPDTSTTRLLISDSTIQDVDAKHGHPFTDGSKDEIHWDKTTNTKVLAAVAQTIEALSYLTYSAGPHRAYDEWADPRLEPLVQHNYPSLTQFNFPSRHLSGAYRVITEAYYPPRTISDYPTHHLDDLYEVDHKPSCLD